MKNYARIISDVAVDVSTDPANSFHPTIAAEFVGVPDEVRPQWRLVDGVWAEPERDPVPDPIVVAPKVSPIEFKLLFTSPERVAIQAGRVDDPMLDDFFSLVDDPRLTFVDLGLQSTKDAIGYLVTKTLLIQERADEVLLGIIK